MANTSTAAPMTVQRQAGRRADAFFRRRRTEAGVASAGKGMSLAARAAVFKPRARPFRPPVLQIDGDDPALDLRGALDDLEDLRVTHPFLDGVVAHHARAAEDLHGLGRRAHGGVGGESL